MWVGCWSLLLLLHSHPFLLLRLYLFYVLGAPILVFTRWHSGKDSACQCRKHKRCRFHPWVRRIPWGRKGLVLVFLPGNSIDRGAWQAAVHAVTKSWTQQSTAPPHSDSNEWVMSEKYMFIIYFCFSLRTLEKYQLHSPTPRIRIIYGKIWSLLFFKSS